MRTSFLDYYKMVLDKVSFEEELFRKEYQKAMKGLVDYERDELDQWVRDRGYPGLLCAKQPQMEMIHNQ